jgi:tetratricopeptide (TPR) repeat protein
MVVVLQFLSGISKGEFMKRIYLGVAVLTLAASAVAQTSAPSKDSGAATQNGTQAATAAPVQGKLPPQAKTQAEFDAFNQAKAATDPDAMEKAADDFAAKYPTSELRIILYERALNMYQHANDADKMEGAARKVLALDPDQPEALMALATSLLQKTQQSDLDKAQRIAEAQKNAEHALQTLDTDLTIDPSIPQEKVDAYKAEMRSDAYSIIGTAYFEQNKFADAADNYQKSIDALPSDPDPVVVLRLALALDKEGKYTDALQAANRAVSMTQPTDSIGSYARREQDRLKQLTAGSIAMPSHPAGNSATPAPPK